MEISAIGHGEVGSLHAVCHQRAIPVLGFFLTPPGEWFRIRFGTFTAI